MNDFRGLEHRSIRITASFFAITGNGIVTNDFIQAYLHSESLMTRENYIKPKDKDRRYISVALGQLLKLDWPICGLCDSGDYCFLRFSASSGKICSFPLLMEAPSCMPEPLKRTVFASESREFMQTTVLGQEMLHSRKAQQ